MIREFCKGQIAHCKIPRYVEFVPEFPMTITGKIQKFVMGGQTIEKLGLKAEKTAWRLAGHVPLPLGGEARCGGNRRLFPAFGPWLALSASAGCGSLGCQ